MSNIHQWSLIETNKTNGTAKLKCPVCTGTRKNKSDRSLYVNFNSGVAKCFNCDALFFKESVEKSILKTDYKLPEQTWKNYTNLSDALVKWCEKERKINQFVLNDLNVTEENYYQPALKETVNNIVFNYFEGETLVNKKYRSGNKKFTQSQGGKPILYNINSIIGSEEVYICEGEFDVLALRQIGIKNAVSLPNGANDNDAMWVNSEKYLKYVKKFYIATDTDEKGNDVAEKIAQRLGRWKCERVNFDGKDANDDLISGVLETTIYKTTTYPVSGTFKVFDVYDDILSLYDNGYPKTIYPKHKCFGNLKDNFSVMRGHLVLGTGIPSHGKSNFVEWYCLNLVKDYEMKVSFFSPEHHPLESHQATFIQKCFGRNFFKDYDGTPRLTKYEIAKYAEWANERIYSTCPDKNEFPTWDWLLEKFKEQMFSYGVDIFVIDAFNKLEFTEKGNQLEMINKVLTKLTMFAQMNNVIIFLIAHPTKMKKNEQGIYSIPSLYDVSGSADFRNQTHDGFCIYRYFKDDNGMDEKTIFLNLKTKYSYQGEIGSVTEFSYHKPSGQYYPFGEEYEPFNLLEQRIESEIIEEKTLLPLMNPNDVFTNDNDNDNDVPF